MSLNRRETEVLSTIIQDYINRATPVGSRTVAKRSRLGLSPASIRNIMADLTDKGYLEQPHTSAGRVPTLPAFRFYLDHVVKLQPLSQKEKQSIAAYLDDSGLELSEVLKRASKLLSSFSCQVSMVLAPNRSVARWKQIEFVLLRPGMVAAILILQEGLVQNKVIHVDEKLTPDELTRYRNYLNDLFEGKTIGEIRNHILREMEQVRERFNDLYRKALGLARQTFMDDSREIFVEGTSHILNHPEFSDLTTMRELFKILEERSQLLEILDKVTGEEGIKIILEQETELENLSYGLISSPYGSAGEAIGALGIIGPLRMNYSKVVPVVDFTAQMLSEVLKKRM